MPKRLTIIAIIMVLSGVFFIEMLTPLGYVEWVLYFIPFIIASRLVNRLYTLMLSGFIILLIAAGFFMSPAGSSSVALTNRFFGILAVLLMSYVILQWMRAEENIRHLAHHDPLTGLPNRRLFMDLAELELARARRNGKKMGVLYLDLDGFKEVNDTHGHEVGDKLLNQVAERLKGQIRKSDAVARMGGDEFNVLLSDAKDADGAAHLAAKIIEAFRKPFSADGHELRVTISIGVSIYPDDCKDMVTLIKNADSALYQAKQEGKNTFRLYQG